LIPASQPVPRAYCDIHFQPARTFTQAEASIQQVLRSNVLLQWDGQSYQDHAGSLGLEIGGWSWDTKLVDHAGNSDGIGAVVILTTLEGNKQVREIQLGGGFMSFDPPIAHIGLAGASQAKALHILWPNGEETSIQGPLSVGASYQVTRMR
jgi:hypothetical protein